MIAVVALFFLVGYEPVLANETTDAKALYVAEKEINKISGPKINNEIEKEKWDQYIYLFENFGDTSDDNHESQNSFAIAKDIEKPDRKNMIDRNSMDSSFRGILEIGSIYETEPNSTLEKANPVRLDNNIFGTITDRPNDLDFYRLHIEKDGWFSLYGGWLGDYAYYGWEDDLYIGLTDSYGNILAWAEYNRNENGSAIVWLAGPLDPGIYYIVVLANDEYGDLYVNQPYFFNITMEYLPEIPTNFVVESKDFIYPGVDGRDFTVTWTPSVSPDIISQKIFILPAGTIVPEKFYDYFIPAAVFNNNTTCSWTGDASLKYDSNQPRARLTGGAYDVYLVVENDAGYAWVYDTIIVGIPAPATNVIASDNDFIYPGVDGRDFSVYWTPSVSTDVTSVKIYILPVFRVGGEPNFNIPEDPDLLTPVAVFYDNTTSFWTGDASLTLDSSYPRVPLQEGEYVIIIVTFNEFNGAFALDEGNFMNAVSETAGGFVHGDVNGDGIVDIRDLVLIARYIAGTLDVFPIEQM